MLAHTPGPAEPLQEAAIFQPVVPFEPPADLAVDDLAEAEADERLWLPDEVDEAEESSAEL